LFAGQTGGSHLGGTFTHSGDMGIGRGGNNISALESSGDGVRCRLGRGSVGGDEGDGGESNLEAGHDEVLEVEVKRCRHGGEH